MTRAWHMACLWLSVLIHEMEVMDLTPQAVTRTGLNTVFKASSKTPGI